MGVLGEASLYFDCAPFWVSIDVGKGNIRFSVANPSTQGETGILEPKASLLRCLSTVKQQIHNKTNYPIKCYTVISTTELITAQDSLIVD